MNKVERLGSSGLIKIRFEKQPFSATITETAIIIRLSQKDAEKLANDLLAELATC